MKAFSCVQAEAGEGPKSLRPGRGGGHASIGGAPRPY